MPQDHAFPCIDDIERELIRMFNEFNKMGCLFGYFYDKISFQSIN